MSGWLHALLVADGVIFSPPSTGQSAVFQSPTDALAAIIVKAHSAGQTGPIADFSNNGTATPTAAFTFRGNGEGSFEGSPVIFEIIQETDADWGFVYRNKLNPNVDGGMVFYVDSSGNGSIQNSPNGTILAAITFQSTGGILIASQFGSPIGLSGDVVLSSISTKVGFFGTSGTAKATVTGSKGANAALASLMTALAAYGLVTDTTT